MESTDARDHLRLVDRIVATTDREVRFPPALLIVIGIAAGLIDALKQARLLGMSVPDDRYVHLPLIGLIIVVGFLSAWRGRNAGRESLMQGYAGGALFIAFIVTMTLNLTAQDRVITDSGMALLWSTSFILALMFAGIMGSRLLLVCGVAMLACTAAASLVGGWMYGMLALGWVLGFLLPGVVLAFGARHGRSAAV